MDPVKLVPQVGPELALVAAVFRRALLDEDVEWLDSDSAQYWAEAAGLDVEAVRRLALSETEISQPEISEETEMTEETVEYQTNTSEVAARLVEVFKRHRSGWQRRIYEYPYLVLFAIGDSRKTLEHYPGTALKEGESLRQFVERIAPKPGKYEIELRFGGKGSRRMTRRVNVEAQHV